MDTWTQVPVYLELYFNDQYLSRGTGFLWRMRGGVGLVTNWHVVSGRDRETGNHLNTTTLAEPNKIKLFLLGDDQGRLIPIEYDLRDDEGHPRWLVHPDPAKKCDVAVVPIRLPDGIRHPMANDLQSDDFNLQVAEEVFILGYPLKLAYLPSSVWKRGTMATEPRATETGFLDYYVVDATTKSGMSGAPVIARRLGDFGENHNGISIRFGEGPQSSTRLLGVYSGRLKNENNEDVQVGRVWPVRLISEIDMTRIVDT